VRHTQARVPGAPYGRRMGRTPLGDFLRARRARITPADVGLVDGGRRQVTGLRREEVALLAGVSVDYYIRLEQGREQHPSAQVLDALSAALRLTDDGRLHLFRLVGLGPRPRSDRPPERVDPHLLQLMDMWPHNPALVLGRAYDVLARNALGDTLFSGFRRGANLLHAVFLDPDARAFYAEWERAAANTVAGFRLLHGAAPDDPRVRELLRGLLGGSREFARLWARHDARGKGVEVKRFVHPEVGPLELRMQAFDVRSAPGQQLVVYHAEPGSPSADGLTLLGTVAATRGAP
jgi:transcriptional regulator with XRE-family HTH domain